MLATLRGVKCQPSLDAYVLAVAASLAVLAPFDHGWPGGDVGVVAWMAFLVLTIAGERLELSRFLPPSPWAMTAVHRHCGVCCWRFPAVAVAVGTLGHAGAAHSSPWLAGCCVRDVARRTVRQRGLVRFIAVCSLSGYAWLLIGGSCWQQPVSGFLSGAARGVRRFVLAMVFGRGNHSSRLSRVALPYHAGFICCR